MVATAQRQIEAMKERYPQLTGKLDGNLCLWAGPLKPFRKEYKIHIRYEVPQVPSIFDIIDIQPRVRIINPKLEKHPEYEEGPIPHIYQSQSHKDHPSLCLFQPSKGEWTIDNLVAQTTIPWTERWLGNYEFWLATGLWKGGGHSFASSGFGDDQKPQDGSTHELEAVA